MNTKKKRLISILTASVLLASSVSGLLGIASSNLLTSMAEESYNSTSLFTSNTNSDVLSSGTYTQLEFVETTGNAVTYNRDLAYEWFTREDGEDPEANYLTLELSFDTASFDVFTVSFEAGENSKSIDEVTTNDVVFLSDGSGYSVAIRNNDDKDLDDDELETVSLTSLGSVSISLSRDEDAYADSFEEDGELSSGEYYVIVSVDDQEDIVRKFTNVRGSYAEYTASQIVPITFSADVSDSTATTVSVVSLNGQSFALDSNGQITDDVAPVLVVDDNIQSFILGVSILNSFSYATIDVCDSTVSVTREYYQYSASDTEASYSTLSSSTKIYETSDDEKEYISIRFTLNDDGGNETESYVDWYAKDRSDVTTFGDLDYLSVIINSVGPEYTCIDSSDKTNQYFYETEAYETYVEDVETAASELRAGEGYYFYLPALEDLIEDDDTPYTSLSFTIYYRSDGNSSTSTVADNTYDDLQFPINTVGGYEFKVVATDKSGNQMKFYDAHGNLIDISTDNIWDVEQIPSFTFYVGNKGLEIEELSEENYAYVYSNYTIEDFEIKGLSGYASDYELYYLEGLSSSDVDYGQMIDFANYCLEEETYSDETNVDKAEFLSALVTFTEPTDITADDLSLRVIDEYDDNGPEDEDDDGWDEHDNRYNWSKSSLSFTPQELGYYVLRVELVDSQVWSKHIFAYKIIYSASPVDETYGDTYWIENNVVTVVFIIIAALSAIGLLVVWIVFPSGETVEGEAGADGKKNKKVQRKGRDNKSDKRIKK